jgi:hypothetical protein
MIKEIVVMKIKDKHGKYASSCDEHGIRDVLLCQTGTELIQISNDLGGIITNNLDFIFNVYYQNNFAETIIDWASTPLVLGLRLATIKSEGDTQSKEKKSKIIREYEFYNVAISVINDGRINESRVATLNIHGRVLSDDKLPGLIVSDFIEQEKGAPRICEKYINLMSQRLISDPEAELWNRKLIDPIL